MRAEFIPTGLSIKVFTEDKDKEVLECIVSGDNSPKLILCVQDSVSGTRGFEEPGFHILRKPSRDYRKVIEMKEIYVFIDRKIHHKIFEEYDDEFQGGFFITRSSFGRVDINYWDPNIHPKIEEEKRNNLSEKYRK